MIKHLCGVDEVGRGPLAGPVTVCVVCLPVDFDWSLLAGVGDSKKISRKNRLAIFARTNTLKKTGVLDYTVSSVAARQIDKLGITEAIKRAIERALKKIEQNRSGSLKEEGEIRLDGSLFAPSYYLNQKTIIKGDASEPVIGLASIIAKVTRDSYMERLSAKSEFSPYNFAQHKGYGTKGHILAIERYGLSSQHRRSFCRQFSQK